MLMIMLVIFGGAIYHREPVLLRYMGKQIVLCTLKRKRTVHIIKKFNLSQSVSKKVTRGFPVCLVYVSRKGASEPKKKGLTLT